MRRDLFDDEHEQFRDSYRKFLEREVVPHYEKWEDEGIVPREVFAAAGELGFMGMSFPEEYGGGGVDDYRFNVVLAEESARAATSGFGLGVSLHTDICTPYLLRYANDDQKARWFPGAAAGTSLLAVAMTEPGTGSDLAGMTTRAIRDGDVYVLDGAKTFISSGINADLVICAAKTDPAQRHAGMSLLVVERDTPGFERGRNLDKIGMHAQDTAELFFDGCRVPAANLLGDAEGSGFTQLVANLPQERLGIAVGAIAGAEAAFGWTLDYVKERHAFGKPIGSFQNSRFEMAEMRTELDIAQVYIDRCIAAHNREELTADEAAAAKWWCTDLQCRVVDRCLQLHGGYGYMREYKIARAYVDARIQRIYGGTNEIMKEIIGRGLGL